MTAEDERLERLARLIAGSPHNLVSARQRDVARLLEGHLREAAVVGPVLGAAPGQRWLDLGTGGGIPGLVLAMRYPEVDWVLIDSVEKKVRAVREFAGDLGLANVSVAAGRAESLARGQGFRGMFDGVVARAVAPLVVLVELSRGFVRDGGVLAAVKGPSWETEVAEAAWAMEKLGWRDVYSHRLRSTVRSSWVVTMRAAGALPGGVPRGPGVPQRRPLSRRTSVEP